MKKKADRTKIADFCLELPDLTLHFPAMLDYSTWDINVIIMQVAYLLQRMFLDLTETDWYQFFQTGTNKLRAAGIFPLNTGTIIFLVERLQWKLWIPFLKSFSMI